MLLNPERTFKTFAGIMVAWVILYLAIIVGVVLVAIHFIAKYW